MMLERGAERRPRSPSRFPRMHAWVFRAEDDAFEMVNDGAVGAIAEFVYVNTSQNSRGSMREDDLLHVWLRRKSN
jgi:hypothetical protein